MIDNELLNKILSEARVAGYEVKVRDVCFVFLCKHISDKAIAFRSLFDKDGKMDDTQVNNYLKSGKIQYLEDALKPYDDKPKSKRRRNEDEYISFDENLAYMLKLKKETETGMKTGEIDKTAAIKILSDITVRLNDKFKIIEENKEQMVVVNSKYDYICPVCSTEVSRRPISKEEAMEMYGLIESNK